MKLSFLFAVLAVQSCLGHMRFDYPDPRSSSYGIKTGPCGDETDDWTGSFTDVSPGILTVTITESVHHEGAPYSVRLSRYEDDTYDCVLLDHIPQHTLGSKETMNINVTIPNVNCSKCALQMISIMTDKIDDGECCDYEVDGKSGSCFSNYHSCANINILFDESATDFVGSRDELECSQPSDWPYRSWTTNVYTQEESSTHWVEVNNELNLIIPGDSETNPCGGGSTGGGSDTMDSNETIGMSPDPNTSSSSSQRSVVVRYGAWIWFAVCCVFGVMQYF